MPLIYCIQDQEATANSTVQPTPHKASGSKKRTLEAVDLAEIPNMRPAKVVRLNQKGGSTQQPEKEDHAIQQVGIPILHFVKAFGIDNTTQLLYYLCFWQV